MALGELRAVRSRRAAAPPGECGPVMQPGNAAR